MAYVKFLGVWLVTILVTAGVLFMVTGTPDTLSSGVRETQTAAQDCDNVAGGIADISQEECLETLARTLRSTAETAQSDILFWHFCFGLLVLVLGIVFMFQIMSKDAVAGTEEEFESLKGTWFIYLAGIVLVMIVATFLARILDPFGKWASLLEPALAWGIPAGIGLVWVVTYWVGTKISTPSKMQPSIPPG